MNETRFERQELFFGTPGQEKLRKLEVAVVGAGGLGSHVLQQLAFLGVGKIIAIDPQPVDTTNLNRLIGAHHDDASQGTMKADVAARLVHEIDPEIEFVVVRKNVISNEAFEAIAKSDYVFGCVDHDGPRLVLTEFSAAYRKPYFDLASEIIEDGVSFKYGGRVCFAEGGSGCLVCMGEISQSEAGEYFTREPAKTDQELVYGVRQPGIDRAGPSVVSLNGVVASIAVTEFMVQSTNVRKARRLLRYRADESRVTVVLDEPLADCYYCKAVFGRGKLANVERYLA